MKITQNISKLITLSVLGWSMSSEAVWDKNYERPILEDRQMEVTESHFGFQGIETISVTLTKRDGSKEPTGIVVEFTRPENGETVVELLPIDKSSINYDECNSRQLNAALPTVDPANGYRMNVSIIDHTTRLCEDLVPNLWEVQLNEGYGWCGTMDNRLVAVGEAAPVVTIQDLIVEKETIFTK